MMIVYMLLFFFGADDCFTEQDRDLSATTPSRAALTAVPHPLTQASLIRLNCVVTRLCSVLSQLLMLPFHPSRGGSVCLRMNHAAYMICVSELKRHNDKS